MKCQLSRMGLKNQHRRSSPRNTQYITCKYHLYGASTLSQHFQHVYSFWISESCEAGQGQHKGQCLCIKTLQSLGSMLTHQAHWILSWFCEAGGLFICRMLASLSLRLKCSVFPNETCYPAKLKSIPSDPTFKEFYSSHLMRKS